LECFCIAKVFSLTLAYKLKGEEIWKRVGVEPSGNPFNSLIQLEQENGIPRNPLINSGALVISDILYDTLSNPKVDLLNFIREITDNQHIEYNIKVANSEKTFNSITEASKETGLSKSYISKSCKKNKNNWKYI
jgi:glutaminase